MAVLFGVLDYVIFVVIVVISLATGIYHAIKGGKNLTTYEFLLASRKLTSLPVALSLMASGESAIMMLGVPAEVAFYGAQWIFSIIGSFCGRMFAAFFITPFIHQLNITSANKYLEERYKSPGVKRLACVITLITTIQYLAIALLAPAMAVEAVMGLPYWTTIVTLATAAIIYTACGGLRAVVWTDVFQGTIMYIGMIVFLIKGTIDAGGVSYVLNVNQQSGRFDVLKFDLDPTVRHTFWGLFINGIISGTFFVFGQSNVQRVSSISNVRDAKLSYGVSAISFLIIVTLAGSQGLVIYAYYNKIGCDPLASKRIQNINQVLPYMVGDIFENVPGLAGLFISAIICAALSTISTCLGSCATILWEDLIKPYAKIESETRATVYNRLIVVVIGVIAIAITFFMTNVKGPLHQILRTFTGSLNGPVSGLFLFGCFCPWFNKYGSVGGGAIAAAILSWIAFGQMFGDGVRETPYKPPASTEHCYINSTSSNFTDHLMANESGINHIPENGFPVYGLHGLYSLSYLWIFPLCMLITFITGTVISKLTERWATATIDKKFIYPIPEQFCWCCPSLAHTMLPCWDSYGMIKKTGEELECAFTHDKIHPDDKETVSEELLSDGKNGSTHNNV